MVPELIGAHTDTVFERMTEQTRRAVVDAHLWAGSLEHTRLGTEHLLVGVLRGERPPEPLIGLRQQAVEERVVELTPNAGPPAQAHLPFTARAKRALGRSVAIADDHLHAAITPTHLLLALVDDSGTTAVAVLRALDVDTDGLADDLRDVLDRLG